MCVMYNKIIHIDMTVVCLFGPLRFPTERASGEHTAGITQLCVFHLVQFSSTIALTPRSSAVAGYNLRVKRPLVKCNHVQQYNRI